MTILGHAIIAVTISTAITAGTHLTSSSLQNQIDRISAVLAPAPTGDRTGRRLISIADLPEQGPTTQTQEP